VWDSTEKERKILLGGGKREEKLALLREWEDTKQREKKVVVELRSKGTHGVYRERENQGKNTKDEVMFIGKRPRSNEQPSAEKGDGVSIKGEKKNVSSLRRRKKG